VWWGRGDEGASLSPGNRMESGSPITTMPDSQRPPAAGDSEPIIRLRRAYDHLLKIPRERILRELRQHDPNWNWGADYAGRWIGAVSQSAARLGADDGPAREVARELVALQHPDGSFGFNADDRSWFGMGRALAGLLDYFEATEDERGFDAARKLADFIAAQARPAPNGWQASCLQGLVMLMAHGPDISDRYLPAAERLAQASAAHAHPEEPFPHAHSFLLAARGLLSLHRLTGDEGYLERVQRLHDIVGQRHAWVSGGIPERLDPVSEQDETCATADWFHLNLDLFRATRDGRYLRTAARVLANHLYFGQASNGGFAAGRDLDGNHAGEVRDFCCSMHGARALAEAAGIGLDPTAGLDESDAAAWLLEPVGNAYAIYCGPVLYVRLAERGKPLLVPEDPRDLIVQGTGRGFVNAGLVNRGGHEVWCTLFPLKDFAPEVVTVHIGHTTPCRAKKVQYLFEAAG
jgi:hypothetical protein